MQVESRFPGDDPDHLVDLVGRDPELGRVVAGHHGLVCLGVQCGAHPQKHRNGFVREPGEALDVIEVVDDDVAHPCAQRGADVVVGLGVAVEHHSTGVGAGGERESQFTCRSGVDAAPLFLHHTDHRCRREALRREQDQ